MKARLLKDMRINHKAGEIVEVSPEQFNFLTSVGAAKLVVESKPVEAEKPKRGTKKKA